jgi:hypothetical protein
MKRQNLKFVPVTITGALRYVLRIRVHIQDQKLLEEFPYLESVHTALTSIP